ncbi:putative reverse transcriptase zinc-binding domain-containing protein [Helianthus annuus]|nr:putative reverse transcriptase zinc-binding domain-containing protein [Helianthus annuus]
MELCKWVPSKCNIHAWRLEMDRLPTKEALRKRNVPVGDISYPFCGSDDESAENLFIACFVASNVWNGISSWCRIPNIFAFTIKDLLDIHKDQKAGFGEKEGGDSRNNKDRLLEFVES